MGNVRRYSIIKRPFLPQVRGDTSLAIAHSSPRRDASYGEGGYLCVGEPAGRHYGSANWALYSPGVCPVIFLKILWKVEVCS